MGGGDNIASGNKREGNAFLNLGTLINILG